VARGDIYWVEIPYSAGTAGREQSGRRPSIVVQSDSSANLSTVMIVPTTSNTNALRFPHTIEVKPSSANGLSQTSILLVFQLRAIDKRRVVRKIGTLEQIYLDRLDIEIKSLLDL
jgi:mRNA interferase MazF